MAWHAACLAMLEFIVLCTAEGLFVRDARDVTRHTLNIEIVLPCTVGFIHSFICTENKF
jgi:hypothetical protein